MSALARHFHQNGCKVSGYDKTETALTNQLITEGIDVNYEDTIITLESDADLVVYTPAIPSGHNQLNYYKNNGFSTT